MKWTDHMYDPISAKPFWQNIKSIIKMVGFSFCFCVFFGLIPYHLLLELCYQTFKKNGGFLKDIFPHSKIQKIMKHYLTIVGWPHTNIYVNKYKIDKFNIPKPEIVFCFYCNSKQICTVQNYWFCKRNCKTTQRNIL